MGTVLNSTNPSKLCTTMLTRISYIMWVVRLRVYMTMCNRCSKRHDAFSTTSLGVALLSNRSDCYQANFPWSQLQGTETIITEFGLFNEPTRLILREIMSRRTQGSSSSNINSIIPTENASAPLIN